MDKFLIRPGSAKWLEESQKNDEQDKGREETEEADCSETVNHPVLGPGLA